MPKPVILTGLRANNNLHIGHYFGALLPLIDMATKKAGEYQINLFVPDLHSFTTPIDHSQLQAQIMQNLKVFVAAGLPLDNDDVFVYRQSYLPAHAELAWILDCFTGVGEMNRMTQFKDKSAGLSDDRVSVGLFGYPVLMAADILLYGAEYVPVGDDQTQHLEFTRDIAERINNQFGDIFIVPKPVKEQHKFFGKDQGLRMRDLQNPAKKMSKSDETGKGVLFLTDTPEVAHKKVMSAETDSVGAVHYDEQKQPGISNLLQMHALLSGETLQAAIEHHDGQASYGDLKREVADQVAEFLTDFQTKLAAVDEAEIRRKLEGSELLMDKVGGQRLFKLQQAVGLRPLDTR
ncbi:MAG TPA: tryptophan--tRNA ligase [Candidatus Saccharimonadales bacterium]|nr:tryptophan--tRNA ligase [Candidatus Saccharimonadales bacterium]